MREKEITIEHIKSRLAHYEARTLPGEWKRAAVLVTLVDRKSPSLLLTQRTKGLHSHAGQVAFPGGKQEQHESLLQCALRETEEEVGLPSTHVEIIGRLSEVISLHGIAVTPFVAYSRQLPTLTPNPSEVSKIFEIPLDYLLHDPRQHTDVIELDHTTSLYIPSYTFKDYTLWGLSAMISVELMHAGCGLDISLTHAPSDTSLRQLRPRRDRYPLDYWR